MGGPYTDHSDPRLRARAEMSSATNHAAPDGEPPSLSTETKPTPANDMNEVEPVETAPLTAIPVLDDDKKTSPATNGDRTSTCNNSSDLHVYINDLLAQITEQAKAEAALIQQCADVQKEHVATTAKYKKAHSKWNHSNGVRLVLEESYQKCVKEKDEAIATIETLRKKNADLLQTHADLGQESAELKGDNAGLVAAVQSRNAMITQLQAEVASLKASGKPNDAEQMQHESVKAERVSLQKRNDSTHRTPTRENDRERGRSRFRSRSPQRSSDRNNWQSTYHDGNSGLGYRERSRGRSSYRGREYQSDDRYKQYAPRYGSPPAGSYRREPSRPAPRGLSRPAPRESDRILTPRETPETHYTPSSQSPYDFPNIGKTREGSHQSKPDGIPTAPRSHFMFSMGQAKTKLSPKEPKRENERYRFGPDKK